jgi:branched-chain amino acid transport system ATP-binding protein/urea transport system ATP-binding protein
MMLEINDLHASYGGSLILQGVDLSIQKGEIKALMGRNGMGKTTLLKTIMGLLVPHSGNIVFEHKHIEGKSTHEIAARGISYVPQGREIFSDFTVAENLRLGLLRNPRRQRSIPKAIFEYFPILFERQSQRAGSFSGGEQQMLAIARALVSRPKLLLLDEPSEGIQPSIVDQICEILKKISLETGLTILIVEQNVDMIMEVAAGCSFLEKGRIVQTCSVSDIQVDESIIACHMGV